MIKEVLTTEVKYNCDILVVGGGFGGIAAAVAAARSGKKVILTERMFMLGGLGTSGLVTIYLPLCDGYGRQVSFGLAEELLKLTIEHHCDKKRGYENWIESSDPSGRNEKTPRYEVNFNPQLFAISAEQMLISLGVKILYGTTAVSVAMNNIGDKISAVVMENKSGRFAISAKSFVDASGDADLAKFSNAPTVNFSQGNILAAWYYFFGKEGYGLRPLGCADVPEEDKKKGRSVPVLNQRRFGGTDGEEISEFVCMSHASTLNDFLKCKKEDETFEPVTIATIPQIRMTRRIDGEYTLSDDEMHKPFEDSCGMVSDWRKRGPVYEVPFRTLYSAKVKNLIFAGRCTSVTDGMWDIMRVIPCCSVTGEAAGVAASMTDDFSTLNISDLQMELKSRGVVIHEADLEG